MKTTIKYIKSIHNSISLILLSILQKAGQGGSAFLKNGARIVGEVIAVVLTLLIMLIICVASLTISAAHATIEALKSKETGQWFYPVQLS